MGAPEDQHGEHGQSPIPAQQPDRSEDGVDLTLIRWMLSMDPTERLRTLQQAVRSLEKLRGGTPRD